MTNLFVAAAAPVLVRSWTGLQGFSEGTTGADGHKMEKHEKLMGKGWLNHHWLITGDSNQQDFTGPGIAVKPPTIQNPRLMGHIPTA